MKCNYAIYQSPIGEIRIEHKDNRLTLLKIETGESSDLGTPDNFSDNIFRQIMEYLKLERNKFDIKVDISQYTPFQQAVFKELISIPYGETRSYKEIATAIGNPKASRAVGAANNQNPIHIIIPCHRVIGARGALVGYAAGVEIKEFLLNLETLPKDIG